MASFDISSFLTFALGALLAAFLIWLLMRNRTESARLQAKAVSDIELARLAERIAALSSELDREHTRANTLQTKAEELENRLSVTEQDNAKLSERASHSSALESDIHSLRTQLSEEAESTRQQVKALNEEKVVLTARVSSITSTAQAQSGRIQELDAERQQLHEKRDELLQSQEHLTRELARVTATLNNEREQMPEKLALLEAAKKQLSDTFRALAGDILEEKGSKFAEHSKADLGHLLEPLKEKLQEFQEKVDQIYISDTKGRTELAGQLKQLMALSERVSDDAKNLATALKGSSKTQGNWGELILERMLEFSGLTEGRDYRVQETHKREDGSKARPDIILNLPESRHMVVDSKVSLSDYQQFVNAVGDEERDGFLKGHLASVRRHIKDLSERNYQELYALNSLDFTIMFVPIESAFALAISADDKLWREAWDKNVLLVSPSSLLFVLRTVAYLWRQEDQAHNVREIADRGAELYDKFVGFVADLDKVGDRLRLARESFDSAYNKLATGRGNLVRQAEKLRELGVRPTKPLPTDLIEASREEPLVVRAQLPNLSVEGPSTEHDHVDTPAEG